MAKLTHKYQNSVHESGSWLLPVVVVVVVVEVVVEVVVVVKLMVVEMVVDEVSSAMMNEHGTISS